ncbi:ATP-binding protein [Gemmatimonadota bacterium DH-20]|uniref:histidine kinase n=1 Tax=Gaopeijia maritima TaxID=3119007 RepID=A0ABU9EBB7_9BACT
MSRPRSPRSLAPELLPQLVEQTPALVLVTDRRGRIVFVNRGFTNMTGYTESEALGRTPSMLKSGLRDDAVYADLWRTVLDGRSWNRLLPNRRKDGSVYWQETSVFPLEGTEGDGLHLAAVGRDVSDRVAMTEELAAARDAAEAAARVKSMFLMNMSHELRTPLNAVLGMAELLVDSELDLRQRTQLGVLRNAAESLLGLVTDIMDLADLDAGGIVLDDGPVELRTLLESAGAVIAPLAHDRRLEVLVSLHPRVDRVWRGDAGRIQQALMNLLSNAVKFTDEGEVEVRAEPRPEGGGVRISVRDTGIGIAPDHLERAFERFSQVDGSTTRRHEGSGLGLTLARELCILMGGRLEVTSRVAHGSTFTMDLPLAEQRGAWSVVDPVLRGLRILVVDDHAGHRAILSELLREAGAETAELDRLDELAARAGSGSLASWDALVVDDTWREGDLHGTLLAVGRGAPDLGVVLLTRVQDEERMLTGIHARVTQPASRERLVAAVRGAHGAAGCRPRPRLGEKRPGHDPHHVLIVDDNAVTRLLLQAMLSKQGCVVEEAMGGAEALARLNNSAPPDAILVGLDLQRAEGAESVRAMRAMDGERGAATLPIVAYSAADTAEARSAAAEAGCDGLVTTPFRKEELLAVLRAAAAKWEAARSA